MSDRPEAAAHGQAEAAGAPGEAVRALVEEAYALALVGDPGEALRLLDDANDIPANGGPSRECLELARARIAIAGSDGGRRAEGDEALRRLAAGSGTVRWRAKLELAREARRKGRSQDAAALLRDAVRELRRRAERWGAAVRPLSRLVADEVERLRRPAARSGDSGEIDAAELMALVQLGRSMAAETDPDELLRLVLHEAISLTGAERGFVVTDAGEELEFAAAENLDRSEIERPAFEVSRTLIREVSRTRRVELLRVPDLPDEHPAGRSLGALGIRVCACVPISGSSGVRGVLYLDSREQRSGLARSKRKLFELFAEQVAAALDNATSHREMERALERAEETVRRQRTEGRRRARYEGMVGASEPMQEVYRRLDLIVPTEEPVIIFGETGTGKDLAARLIHSRGPRSSGEFVAINCAGLAETLLEAELFGHERGAFTGADRARAGLFEVAHRGTLFLDEVGDMSPRMQGDLLRVLQSGEVRRVGGRATSRVDVRLIAATHRDLQALVRRGDFREDLFFRLNVLELHMPPLRERADDIALLVAELLPGLVKPGQAAPALSGKALARVMAYDWPGNFRELENFLRRLAVLGIDRIEERHLPEEILQSGRRTRAAGTLRAAEEDAIRRAMEAASGNKAEAARILGVDRKTLYSKLKRMRGGR